jgi:hypothetical protein
MGDSDKIPAGAEPDRYRKKGGACAPPPHKPRGGHGALAGEEESSRSGSLSVTTTHALFARSKSSEQWCCWIGRSLIIAGSAENRSNSCPSQQLPHRTLGIVILGNRANQYPNEVGRRIMLDLAASRRQRT